VSHTKGPWRWGDWSADFGKLELDRRTTLEHNATHPDARGPVFRKHDDVCYGVLRLEEEVENPADAELIRRAPELHAALVELLDRFGDQLSENDLDRLTKLVPLW
jgi:hypothetical protein